MKNAKRIENSTSRTAEMTCVSRAVSFYEKNIYFKSNDYIAPQLLPCIMLPFIKTTLFKNIFKNKMSAKGIYEYVIARTKFIDSIFKAAVEKQFDQILIFGAGFDSRGIRLVPSDSGIKVFELDVPITQHAKIEQLKKRKIEVPSNITFVPIDFNKDSLVDKLKDYGFQHKRKTLFLMEGLIMYLNRKSVDATFRVISDVSGAESEIVFDSIHSSVLGKTQEHFGGDEIVNFVSKSGEQWAFGIDRNELASFLEPYDFHAESLLNSDTLEKMFFTDADGKLISRINETHFIVHAKK